MFAIGVLLLVIGVGVWREREWVRPLMVAYWASHALVGLMEIHVDVMNVISAFVGAGVGAAAAAWYLYRKPNVSAYYASLSRLATAAGST